MFGRLGFCVCVPFSFAKPLEISPPFSAAAFILETVLLASGALVLSIPIPLLKCTFCELLFWLGVSYSGPFVQIVMYLSNNTETALSAFLECSALAARLC